MYFKYTSAIRDAIVRRISHPDYRLLECVRLLHSESHLLRIDMFGKVLAIYWYPERLPLANEQKVFDTIAEFVHAERWVLFPKQKISIPDSSFLKESFAWHAKEHEIIYELRSCHGASPGLFLDQRQQRLWTLENAFGKKVLNLFCYTSGFTLSALKGEAAQVCSVDTSASALAWSRDNLLLNGFSVKNSKFLKEDARSILKRTLAKNGRYDIVVCDPPTFSRGKGAVFSLKREFRELLRACCMIVAPGGDLLFSTNYEGISHTEFHEIISAEVASRAAADVVFYKPTYDYVAKADWELKSARISFSSEST